MEFFSMKEIMTFMAVFFFLGIFIGWSFSQYKVSRLNAIRKKLELFQDVQKSFSENIDNVEHNINHELTHIFNNLKLNKYFSACVKLYFFFVFLIFVQIIFQIIFQFINFIFVLFKYYKDLIVRTPTNDTIDYQDMGFENDPSIFVVTNRFTITYGQEGYLSKANVLYDSNRTYIKFKLSSSDQNTSIPVCVLAFEKIE